VLVLDEQTPYDRRWKAVSSRVCEGVAVFVPTFNPRLANVILGVVIGLVLSLAWHVFAWAIQF
jgi:hypothetical protein